LYPDLICFLYPDLFTNGTRIRNPDLQVDIEEGGVNGLVVRSLTCGGTLACDWRVQPGDYLVNLENLRGVSRAAALAVLRRTQLVPLGKRKLVLCVMAQTGTGTGNG